MRKLHALVTDYPGTYSFIGQDDEVNRRTVWSDDMDSAFLADYPASNEVKELAWSHCF